MAPTPIRPLPSTLLSSKTVPPLPSAAQTYEPLVKTILAQRLARWVFPWTLAASTVLCAFWTWWAGASEDFADFLHAMMLRGVVVWAVCAVPAIVIRKAGLTVSRTPAGSPSQLFSATMARPGARRTLLALAGSAILFGAFFAAADPAKRFALFVNSRKHPLYLNPRFIYLLTAQLAVSTIFFLRLVLRDRLVFPWTAPQLDANLASFALVPTLSAFAALPLAGLALLIGRVVLSVLYRLPVLPLVLRPLTGHFVRGGWWRAIPGNVVGALGEVFLAALLTTVLWDVAFYLFDSCVSMPINATTDPTVLVSAISKPSSDLFQALAFRELRARVGGDDAEFARVLFADTALWPHVVRPALLLLGEDYQRLVRRGKPPPPPSVAPAASPSASTPAFGSPAFGSSTSSPAFGTSTFGASLSSPATPSKPPGKDVPLLRASIFKHAPPSPAHAVANALAADGVVGSVPDVFREGIDSVAHAVTPFTHAMSPLRDRLGGSLERAVSPVKDALQEAVVEPARETRGAVREIVARVREALLPAPVRAHYTGLHHWWTRERAGRLAAGALPRRETDAAVVEALAHLIAHSLIADRFGTVQRDIPRVLEAMVRMLGEIEGWVGELEGLRADALRRRDEAQQQLDETRQQAPADEQDGHALDGIMQEGDALEVQQQRKPSAADQEKSSAEHDLEAIEAELRHANKAFQEVAEALKTGLARIVRTFGTKLSAFRFPPAVAGRLQAWVDAVGV
ncbi:hypothetical protein HDZ31DRAFT_41175 [Schizophyllum fasciatum]